MRHQRDGVPIQKEEQDNGQNAREPSQGTAAPLPTGLRQRIAAPCHDLLVALRRLDTAIGTLQVDAITSRVLPVRRRFGRAGHGRLPIRSLASVDLLERTSGATRVRGAASLALGATRRRAAGDHTTRQRNPSTKAEQSRPGGPS
eukprot:scaffold1616_cov395-Prasinococcus_capsulatus_cf.AAC.11